MTADGQNAPKLIIVGNARGYRPDSKIKYNTRSRVYHPDGIAPTLMATDYKGPMLILERIPNEHKTRPTDSKD